MDESRDGLPSALVAAASVLSAVRSWADWKAVRQSGADPTTLEPVGTIHAGLVQDAETLRAGLHGLLVLGVSMRLERASLPSSLKTLAFISAAADVIPVVHRVHQRLLSICFDVPEHRIEQARMVESRLRRLCEHGPENPSDWRGAVRDGSDLVEFLLSFGSGRR